eukprot:SAG31_NODE_5446_length_2533_cov_1.336072_2_plen_162_part_00
MADSTIAALSQRYVDAPADALVGPSSLGTIMDTYGCMAAPSSMHPSVDSGSALATRYIPGGYSVAAHGSKDTCCNCDAVQIQVPATCWEEQSVAMVAQGAGNGDNPLNSAPIHAWCSRICDALLCWMASNYGFQAPPGAGQIEGGRKTEFKGGRRASVYTT